MPLTTRLQMDVRRQDTRSADGFPRGNDQNFSGKHLCAALVPSLAVQKHPVVGLLLPDRDTEGQYVADMGRAIESEALLHDE